MSDDNLSIKFTEETKKAIYQNNISFSSEKYFILAVVINIFCFIFTYFSPNYFGSDGEAGLYFIYLLGLLGFVIGYEALKLFQKIPSKIPEKEVTNIEAGIMSGYEYISYQDRKWLKWIAAFACGGLNVLAYFIFLRFI